MTAKILELDVNTIEDATMRALVEEAQKAIRDKDTTIKSNSDALSEAGRIKKELQDKLDAEKALEDEKLLKNGEIQKLLDASNAEKQALADKYATLEAERTALSEKNDAYIKTVETSNAKDLDTMKEAIPKEAFELLETKVKDLSPEAVRQEIAFAKTLFKENFTSDGQIVTMKKKDEKSFAELLKEKRAKEREDAANK